MFSVNTLDIRKIVGEMTKNDINVVLINVDCYTTDEITKLYFFLKNKDDLSKLKVPFICFSNNVEVRDELENIYLDVCDDFISDPFNRQMVMMKRIELQLERYFYIKEVKKNSLTDGLLHIPNRKALDQSLSKLYAYCNRNRNHLTFMMIDIDKFKNFNDSYGHDIGDEVLKLVARTLSKECRRETDGVFRYGGEELSVITTGLNKKQAKDFGEKLRKAIENAVLHTEKYGDLHVTVSIGVYCDIPKLSLDEIMKAADGLLYQAKETGRNKVCTLFGI